VFVGMTRDADYGPILAVGRGGIAIEELGCATWCAGHVDVATARALVVEAGIDQAVDAIARALEAVSRAAFEHPEIAEIDVNPLVLHEDAATAVDALVVLAP
jgi:succinyl-CoA synthetase beta subunit